jgi:hypothetical protein
MVRSCRNMLHVSQLYITVNSPLVQQVYSRKLRDASKQTCSTTVSVLYWANPRILDCSVFEDGADRLSQNFGNKNYQHSLRTYPRKAKEHLFSSHAWRIPCQSHLSIIHLQLSLFSYAPQFLREPHIRGNIQGRSLFPCSE